jgi:hypothetical protein
MGKSVGGGNYSIGGSGGGVKTGTSNSMIGGGKVTLTNPGGTFSAEVNFSAPIAAAVEGAAAIKGTDIKNGYQSTNISIFGGQAKVAGVGVGGDFYYDRIKGLSLELDVSAIVGGTLTINADGFTPNGYLSLNTGAGVGALGMGIGGGLASTYDEGEECG